MATMSGPRRALVLVGALLLAACEAAAGSTAESSTAVTPEPTFEMAPPGPLADEGLDHLVAMTGPPNEDGTLGAGCRVDESDDLKELPDGEWYGFVMEYGPSAVTLDVACVYAEGTDQWKAYAQTVEDHEPANHLVTNDVIIERRVRVGRDVDVYLESESWERLSWADARDGKAGSRAGSSRGIWVVVDDGRVVTIVQPQSTDVVVAG